MAHSEKQKAIIERQSGKSTFSSFGKALVMESRCVLVFLSILSGVKSSATQSTKLI